MPSILLHDASILIDLLSVALLDVALDLPFEMETTDLILAEFTEAAQREELTRQIGLGKLSLIRSSTEDLDNLFSFRSGHGSLSLPDCSVIYWARKHAAIILSGDSLIRKVASTEGIKVHGTIWVLEQLVAVRLLPPEDAAARLRSLMDMNDRIPRRECEELLRRWSEMGG